MDKKDNIFKGGLAVVVMLLKGFAIPASIGLVGYGLAFPLKWYDCKAYAESIEMPFKYRYFECYIQTKEGPWLERREYQSSKIGTRLILQPDLGQ